MRQPVRQEQRNGARPGGYSRQNEQPADRQAYAERPQQGGGKQQASFSAYRPEAYADQAKSAGRPAAARPEWSQQQSEPQRPAPDAFRAAPTADRGRPAHDPYYNGGGDPYDAGTRDFDASWHANDYQEPAAEQFTTPSFYAQHEEPNPSDAQTMHDRFFVAEPEPERAPPPPAAPAPRYRQQPQNDFDDDFHDEPRPAPRASKPAPAPAPSAGRGFDEGGGDYRWDSFDQQPAPEAVRPFGNPKMDAPDEDLDADYFDDEYEGEDEFAEPKKGGSKKLMAAVLVGAVVTGGGLAYLYKSQTGGGDTGEPPIMTADSRPIKEQPSDPGGRDFPNGSKLIYDRLGNGGGGADEPTRVAASDAQSSAEVPGVVTTGGSGTLEERIQNALRDAKKQDDPPATAAAATSASSLDTPRSVPTQIFRPDGSVDRSAAQRRVAPADNDAPVANAPRGVVSTQPPQLAGAPQAAPAQQRQQVAAVAPAAPIATASAGGDSGMFVQIAARNDEAAAKAAFIDLQQKYASVLGNHSPSVRKVDLGEKGVWYRLMVGPMSSKADADKLCEDLKTAGMKSCFSRKE